MTTCLEAGDSYVEGSLPQHPAVSDQLEELRARWAKLRKCMEERGRLIEVRTT